MFCHQCNSTHWHSHFTADGGTVMGINVLIQTINYNIGKDVNHATATSNFHDKGSRNFSLGWCPFPISQNQVFLAKNSCAGGIFLPADVT